MVNQVQSGNMQGTCSNNSTTNSLFNTWEVGYNHYHNRMGLFLPETERLLKKKVRNNGWSDWNIFHETLTHAEVSELLPTLKYMSSKIDSNASVIDVKFSDKLILTKNPQGFRVEALESGVIGISEIYVNPTDSTLLHIQLTREVLFNEVVRLFYTGTEIIASDSTALEEFFNQDVEIRLPGAENYITFRVKNKASGLLVEGSLVEFNNVSSVSNASGEVSFRAFNGKYQVSSIKNHLLPIQNRNLTISSDSIIVLYMDSTMYKVTFRLSDNKTGNDLSVVDILIGLQRKNTSTDGKISFLLPAKQYTAYFDKTNYHNFEDTLQIESDTVFPIELERSHAKIKFKIKNGTTPVNNAFVILGIDTLLSNQVGICTFKSVSINIIIPFSVQKENFNQVRGSIKVNNDTTAIQQMLKSVANSEFQMPLKDKVRVYPNPTTNHVTIESSGYNIGWIELYNIQGKRIFYEEYKKHRQEVFLKLNFLPGVYNLKIAHGNFVESTGLIVH